MYQHNLAFHFCNASGCVDLLFVWFTTHTFFLFTPIELKMHSNQLLTLIGNLNQKNIAKLIENAKSFPAMETGCKQ